MIRNGLVVVVAVIIVLLLLELVLRLVRPAGRIEQDLAAIGKSLGPGVDIPYLHRPSCTDCRPQTNALGYPGPEVTPTESHQIDVALIGDSMCVGYTLEYGQTLPAVLEQELNSTERHGLMNYRVRSYCVGGYGLSEYVATAREVVRPLEYDVIVVLLSRNDDSDALMIGAHMGSGQFVTAALAPLKGQFAPFSWIPDVAREALCRNSYLYQEAGTRFAMLLQSGLEHARPDGLMLSESEVVALLDRLLADGVSPASTLGIVLVPDADQGRCSPPITDLSLRDGCLASERPLDDFGRFAEARGLAVLDLRSILFTMEHELGALSLDRFGDTRHYSARGHSAIARAVADFVESSLADRIPSIPGDF